MFSVIIAGSRDFNDYEYLKLNCNHLLRKKFPNVQIVSGCAKGADTLGERYAKDYGLSVKPFPALWEDLQTEPCVIKYNSYGKPYNALAGHNRNQSMADYAHGLIAFYNGSKGTSDMIKKAKKSGLIVKVVRI